MKDYLKQVANAAVKKYGVDYHEALNVAECVISSCKNTQAEIEADATYVYVIMNGEY